MRKLKNNKKNRTETGSVFLVTLNHTNRHFFISAGASPCPTISVRINLDDSANETRFVIQPAKTDGFGWQNNRNQVKVQHTFAMPDGVRVYAEGWF